MADFRLEARTRGGSYLATLPVRNIQGEHWYNRPKQLRFELPLNNVNVTRQNLWPGLTEVQLFRNNTRIFTGPLWDATATSSNNTLACAAESIESYLGHRRIMADLRYTGAASATVWDLINRTQTLTDGGLGITQGTVQVAPNVQVDYLISDGKYLLDCITELAELDASGFDWEINPDRQLNLWYPRPQIASRVKLEYGGAISGYSVQVLGHYEANDIFVKGKDALRSTSPIVDTAKRTEYGLRQLVGSNTGLTMLAQVNDYAQRLLALHRDPKEIPHITLRSTSVNPWDGDIGILQTAQVVIDDGWAQYNQTMRLNGFQYTIGKHGSESFNLYMADLREVA